MKTRKNPIEIMEKELSMLRNELHSLKECQVRYFCFSVTATGILFGLGSILKPSYFSIVYLSPLILVLPCWLIFFDKATTITRIVGYYRVLQYLLIAPTASKYAYLGWENALSLFREMQTQKWSSKSRWEREKERLLNLKDGLFRLITFRTTHRYWVFSWYTFFSLTILCLFLYFSQQHIKLTSPDIKNFTFLGIIIFIVTFNTYVFGSLINGRFSYEINETAWKETLSSPEAQQYLNNRF